MAVIIGSARFDENGKIANGVAGDQKQALTPDYKGEVGMENWYLHKLGWRVFRCKDPAKAEKIAWDMEAACNNKYIGYDQNQDQTLYNVAKPLGFDCSKVKTSCETDCARLVRVCVLYAGITVADFYTANEASALMATGQFTELTDSKFTTSSDYLKRGDILVTKSKGHSAVVLSNGAANDNKPQKYDAAVGGTYQVTDGNKLNMRIGAGTNYAVLEVLQSKTKLPCDGHYTMNGSTKWLYVQHDDVYGYCSTKYLKKVSDTMPAASFDAKKSGIWKVTYGAKLNMRRGAGTGFKVITVLQSGSEVVNSGYYTINGNTVWLLVTYGNKTGYCSTKYLKKV